MIKLALKNLKQQKSRSLLATFTIIIAIASLTSFASLAMGIKNATFQELQESSPLTQITVLPNIENRGLLNMIVDSDEANITPETLEKISQIDGIEAIYPEIQLKNFASLKTSILSMNLMTDSMVFGVKKDFIKNDLIDPEIWDKNVEPYPVIIPRKILDIYNFTIAVPQGLPSLSEKRLIGKEITLFPGYSMFFPQISAKKDEVKLEIAGFSDKVNLVGISLPFEVIENLNKKYSNNSKIIYTSLFVETENESLTSEVAQKIEKLGYDTQYYQKNIQDVEAKLSYISLSLGMISSVILLTSALAIIGIFLSLTIERKKEIGLLRALGARKSQIRGLILFEASILGLFGSIFGILLGIVVSKILDRIALNALAGTTFAPESLFLIDFTLILIILLFGILFASLSALIPAHKAANIDPIEALKN